MEDATAPEPVDVPDYPEDEPDGFPSDVNTVVDARRALAAGWCDVSDGLWIQPMRDEAIGRRYTLAEVLTIEDGGEAAGRPNDE